MNTIDIQKPIPNFIIAGTLKAATTAIFDYLADHPKVCCSSEKETRFFEMQYSGDFCLDVKSYSKFFPTCNSSHQVVMEATPYYLGKSGDVATRIKEMLPEVKLLFLLRNPTDRFYSFYNYHIGHRDFDKFIDINTYFEKCLLYSEGRLGRSEYGMSEWFLKALDDGLYSKHLKEYYRLFPEDNIKVMFHEHLKNNILDFMIDICHFIDIDSGFFNQYDFVRKNITFHPRNRMLHNISMSTKENVRKIIEISPFLKRTLLQFYRTIAMKKGYPPIPHLIKERLDDFYQPGNEELKEILSRENLPDWVKV